MANVKFYLDKSNLFLSYYMSDGVVRLSLKEKIDTKVWNVKKQRVSYQYKEADRLNKLLDELQKHVMQVRLDYKIKGERLTSAQMKQELQKRLMGNNEDLFFNYCKDVFLLDKAGKVAPDTLRTYGICISLLERYIHGISFSQINRALCNKLERKMIDDKYSTNYINRVFKVFHDAIKMAYIDEVHTNKYFMTDGFVPSSVEVDNVYLDVNELNLLYNYLSSAKPKLKNAVAIFLRGCYTGQRYQTYKLLSNTMTYTVNGVDMISIKQQKGNHTVSIPLSEKMKFVLSIETYSISAQNLRAYIKEACKDAGISKWAEVSTHTARRTFATNMVLAGVDVTKIMKITGHKTEQEFRKYVKIDGVQSAVSAIDDINRVFGII